MAAAFLAVVLVPMLLEARLAWRHDRALRARGAVEPPGDVYGLMQLAYPGGFLAMITEGWMREPQFGPALPMGIAVFICAKALKYWAMATLGERWTFRVLVPPGSRRIVTGPYRWLGHPNYVAVIGELAGIALMAHGWLTGPAAIALFAILIRLRIRVEERALRIESPG